MEAIRIDCPGRRFAGSHSKIQFAFSMRSSVDEIFKYSVDVYTVPNNTDPIPQLCVVHICSQ